MTRFLEWLLNLKDIRLGHEEALLLTWGNPLPAWLLACLAIGTLGWIVMVYRREGTSPARRIFLGGIRCTLVALVVAVLCEPTLVLQRNRVEGSYVAVVLDMSQSMAIREPYRDAELAASVARGAGLADPADLNKWSRAELIKAALGRDDSAALRQLLQKNAIQLFTFAGRADAQGWADSTASLDAVADRIGDAQPDGASTDLAGTISQVLSGAKGRRLAGIILATDGRATTPTSLRDATDSASGWQIPLFPIRIGSPARRWDIDVGPVRAEETVFVNDLLAIEAQLTTSGLFEPTAFEVLLIDERSGKMVASRTVSLDATRPSTNVEFHTKPTQAGRVSYRVEVTPQPLEYSTTNNVDRVDVHILDDKLHVLYVEGYPRYEYRYLKNALLREETVELSVLLIEADSEFAQEGTYPIRRFPDTPEELSRYDVVLFGDVNPRGGWLSAAQMNMLLDFVGNQGGGFGLIAGERAAPQRFAGTPLERLIPVRIDADFQGHYDATLSTGFRPQLTPDGLRSRLFRPAPQAAGGKTPGDDEHDPMENLPELFWVARTLGPKPAATVLAEHPTAQTQTDVRAASGQLPIVVVGRYGAGKIFFQATDDTWRWRRHTGELLHDTYWVQTVRELMRGERVGRDRRFVIRTDRRVYRYGSPVQVQVEILDNELLGGQTDAVELLVAERTGDALSPGDATADEQVKGRDVATLNPVQRFRTRRLSTSSRLFEGTLFPPHPGDFLISAEGIASRPGERAPVIAIRVKRPDLEARHPEASHEVLERIAASTGGRVIDLDQLVAGFASIPDRSVQIPDDIAEPLWDSNVVLMVFALMITTEWVLRKVYRLQ